VSTLENEKCWGRGFLTCFVAMAVIFAVFLVFTESSKESELSACRDELNFFDWSNQSEPVELCNQFGDCVFISNKLYEWVFIGHGLYAKEKYSDMRLTLVFCSFEDSTQCGREYEAEFPSPASEEIEEPKISWNPKPVDKVPENAMVFGDWDLEIFPNPCSENEELKEVECDCWKEGCAGVCFDCVLIEEPEEPVVEPLRDCADCEEWGWNNNLEPRCLRWSGD